MGKFQDLAKTLLSKLSGHSLTYKRISGDSGDLMFSNETYETLTLTVYITSPTSGDIASGLASATDVIILVSGVDFGSIVPIEGETVGTYTINRVKPVYEAGGVVALYKLVCKVR